YEPALIDRDTKTKSALREAGVEASSFNGALLNKPGTFQNKSGTPFQVCTPFWKHCLNQTDPPRPTAAPRALAAPKRWPESPAIEALKLEPRVDWAAGLRAAWRPGEAGAQDQLNRFLESALRGYDEARDRPGTEGT